MHLRDDAKYRISPFADNWRALSTDWPYPSRFERHRHRRLWRGRLTFRSGYWIVAMAQLMTMAMSAVPTPLYVLYQRRDHFSSPVVSVIFAVYAAGVIASLFLVGHVSDWLGRRRVLVTGLYLNVASAFVFIVAPTLTGLLVGRVVSGISVGMTTATATAYLAESHQRARPEASPRRAQIVAIAVNLGGIGVGPLIAGVLAQFAPAPLALPYVVVGVTLALLATLVLATPETVAVASPRPRWHPQRVAVPRESRGQFAAAVLAGLAAFAVYGVFSSLVPGFIAHAMGITSHAVAGAVAFSVFASGALAQVALFALTPRVLLRSGLPLLLAGLTSLVVAMWVAALAVFVIGTVLTGIGAGLIFRGAMTSANESARPEFRAEVLAGFFLGSYVGLSAPVVTLGVAQRYASPRTLLLVFSIIVVAVTTSAVWSLEARDPRRGSRLATRDCPAPHDVPTMGR